MRAATAWPSMHGAVVCMHERSTQRKDFVIECMSDPRMEVECAIHPCTLWLCYVHERCNAAMPSPMLSDMPQG